MYAGDCGKLIHRQGSRGGGVDCFLNAIEPARSRRCTIVAQARQVRDHQDQRAFDREVRYGIAQPYLGPNACRPHGRRIASYDLRRRGKRTLTIGLAREPIIGELDVEPLPFDPEAVAVRGVRGCEQEILCGKSARATSNFFDAFAGEHQAENRLRVHVERDDMPGMVGIVIESDAIVREGMHRGTNECLERHWRRHRSRGQRGVEQRKAKAGFCLTAR